MASATIVSTPVTAVEVARSVGRTSGPGENHYNLESTEEIRRWVDGVKSRQQSCMDFAVRMTVVPALRASGQHGAGTDSARR